jgi:ribosome-binding factor A
MPRVNEIMKREIAEFLERMEFGLKKGLVTVSSVKTAPNLRTAIVNISTFNASPSQKEKILTVLYAEKFAIQTRISKNIHIKYTPVLKFAIDDSVERGDRVIAIIRELEECGTTKKSS